MTGLSRADAKREASRITGIYAPKPWLPMGEPASALSGLPVLLSQYPTGPVAVDAVMAALDGNATRYARTDVEAEIAGAEEAAHEARVKARKELHRQRRDPALNHAVRALLTQQHERPAPAVGEVQRHAAESAECSGR